MENLKQQVFRHTISFIPKHRYLPWVSPNFLYMCHCSIFTEKNSKRHSEMSFKNSCHLMEDNVQSSRAIIYTMYKILVLIKFFKNVSKDWYHHNGILNNTKNSAFDGQNVMFLIELTRCRILRYYRVCHCLAPTYHHPYMLAAQPHYNRAGTATEPKYISIVSKYTIDLSIYSLDLSIG